MIHDIPSEYPETFYEEFEVDLMAGHVKKGDRIDYAMVETNKVGTKWSEMRNASGEFIMRVTVDTPVTVTRWRETKASRDAANRHDSNVLIKKALEDMAGAPNPIIEVMNDVLTAEHVYVTYQELQTMARRQAKWRVHNQFVGAWEHVKETDKWEGDYVDFFHEFKQDLQKQILHLASGIDNRSSNAYSNLQDDEKLAAMANFLDDSRWWRV